MAKKKKAEVAERRVTTDEFAVIARCKAKTVRGFCREISKGNQAVLDSLGKAWGLVGVERLSNKWLLTVRPLPAKK